MVNTPVSAPYSAGSTSDALFLYDVATWGVQCNGTVSVTFSTAGITSTGTMQVPALRIDQTPTSITSTSTAASVGLSIGNAQTLNKRVSLSLNGATYWLPCSTSAF